MNFYEAEKFLASASNIRSLSSASGEETISHYQKIICDFSANEVKDENKNGKQRETWLDSDDEFNQELDTALKMYRRKKQTKGRKEKSQSPNNTTNAKTLPENHKSNAEVTASENGAEDVRQLINYFFQPVKSQNGNENIKTYSDYQAQGAIPKYKFESKETRSNNRRKNRKQAVNNDKPNLKIFPDQITSKETFLEPFFYIISENPSPDFILPRGSYYVVPKAPTSSTGEKIIFHPDKNEEVTHEKSNNVPHFPGDSQIMNNLNKEFVQKSDSHLNIGPSDVALIDSMNNSEINYTSKKFFEKTLQIKDERTEIDDRLENERILLLVKEDKLNRAVTRLLMEFPDLSPDVSFFLAEKYLDDDRGLEEYLSSERKKRRIQKQFERLVLALPDNNFTELREKCDEFQGDEDLIDIYIAEQKKINEKTQILLNLQYMFPDADPNFLLEQVELLNGDRNAVSARVEELLESNDYPKISRTASEKNKLWKEYVTDFNVKNYIKKVSKPRLFDDKASISDKELDLKFLKSRFHAPDDSVNYSYTYYGGNLIKTCRALSTRYGVTRLAVSSFENEDFTEEFLKKACYVDYYTEINKYLDEEADRKAAEAEEARLNNCFLSCPICDDEELIASEAVTCPEGHVFCNECIRRYISIKIGDGIFKFSCPLEKCEAAFTLVALEDLLPESVALKIIQKQQAEEINVAEVDGLEFCTQCDFAYIPNPEDKIFKCQNPDCLMEFCRECGEKNHIPLRCEEVERPVDIEARKRIEESMTQTLVRVCPKCHKKIIKIDGCNKMSCTCGVMFCYICGEPIKGYDHFNTPFGPKRCPLYSNNKTLHQEDVVAAGIQARDAIVRENPGVRILYDPSTDPLLK